MQQHTEAELAEMRRRVERIVAQVGDMDLDNALGKLAYMVCYYEMTRYHQGEAAELAALRRRVAELEDQAAPGPQRGSRQRNATPGERAAYSRGYQTGYHAATRALRAPRIGRRS